MMLSFANQTGAQIPPRRVMRSISSDVRVFVPKLQVAGKWFPRTLLVMMFSSIPRVKKHFSLFSFVQDSQ